MRVYVVVGGQFGSEAKGHVAAQLAQREVQDARAVIAVRVAGPNAGHTAYDPKGRPFALRTIPAMAVVDPSIQLVLAAGSEIQPQVLADEIEMLEDAGIPVRDRLIIDAQATLLEDSHVALETGLNMHERLGSTGKGVGAARSARILRKAKTWEQYVLSEMSGVNTNPLTNLRVEDTVTWINTWVGNVAVIIEGTQGYGLGLHAGYYPYCTSSDCRSIDFLAMAGIDPRHSNISLCETWIVYRTYPIRVAGNSGPLYREMSWEELALLSDGHIKPEKTTVTKKIRRVGEWDPNLAWRALQANGGARACHVAMTFLDYIDPNAFGVQDYDELMLSDPITSFMRMVEDQLGTSVSLATTGPSTAVWL